MQPATSLQGWGNSKWRRQINEMEYLNRAVQLENWKRHEGRRHSSEPSLWFGRQVMMTATTSPIGAHFQFHLALCRVLKFVTKLGWGVVGGGYVTNLGAWRGADVPFAVHGLGGAGLPVSGDLMGLDDTFWTDQVVLTGWKAGVLGECGENSGQKKYVPWRVHFVLIQLKTVHQKCPINQNWRTTWVQTLRKRPTSPSFQPFGYIRKPSFLLWQTAALFVTPTF